MNGISSELQTLRGAAESTVSALEQLSPGEAWISKAREAEEAIDALRQPAIAGLFPAAPKPVGSDVLADLDFYLGDVDADSYSGAVLALHGQALSSYPKLAVVLRGPVVRRRLRDAAVAQAGRLNRDRRTHAAGVLRAFELGVAEQMLHRSVGAPWAEILADTVAGLLDRLADAKAQGVAERRAEIRRRICRLRPSASVHIPGERRRRRVGDVAALLRSDALDVHLDDLEQQLGAIQEDQDG